MSAINPKYNFHGIHHALNKLSKNDDTIAQSLGFREYNAIDSLKD